MLPKIWLKLRPPQTKLQLEILHWINTTLDSLKMESICSCMINSVSNRLGMVHSAEFTSVLPILLASLELDPRLNQLKEPLQNVLTLEQFDGVHSDEPPGSVC